MEREQRTADNSVHVSVFSPRATHAHVSPCHDPRPVVVVGGACCSNMVQSCIMRPLAIPGKLSQRYEPYCRDVKIYILWLIVFILIAREPWMAGGGLIRCEEWWCGGK